MKYNKMIPELGVSDFKRTLEFYNLIGFKIEYAREEKEFAFLSMDEVQLMIEVLNGNWETGKPEYPYGRGINFQIEVENVNEIYNKLKQFNYPIKFDMQENWYRSGNVLLGCKEFLVMDPDGYLLRFSQDIGEKEV